MASKICSSCGAKNPSSAYSCSNCATSLIDTSSVSFGSSPPPSNTWSTTSGSQASSNPRLPEQQPSVAQPSTTITTSGPPVAVVQQSPLRSILNALITVMFIVILGLGVGFTSYGTLIPIVVLAAVIAIPVVIGFLFRPKFEFYDSYFERTNRRGSQQINYSEIRSVDKYRSSIRILLKGQESERFGPRAVLIPGDPKLSNGTDLSAWLKSKISLSEESTKTDNEERTDF